jgi:hypothetical protein
MSDFKRDMAMESMARATGTITQEMAFKMLADRLDHARKEHPVFAENERGAWCVIYNEMGELGEAIRESHGPARVLDEALDVAATAMRLVMGEVQE